MLAAFAELLPAAAYLPMLLRVTPRLVTPAAEDDYFAHEQVATWGSDSYEFVVPMVPPAWNDRARVRGHAQLLQAGSLPAAVAVSTLDISQPAMADDKSDYYEHWGLTHFLLDGHHKLEAAAATGRPLQLLALVAIDASLAGESDIAGVSALLSWGVQIRSCGALPAGAWVGQSGR